MAAEAALSRPRRLLILGICCMSLLIVGLDTTIVNVALPSIQRDLGLGQSTLQWIVIAYGLMLGGGRRLLDETPSPRRLRLVESRPVGPDGVVILIYGPAGDDA